MNPAVIDKRIVLEFEQGQQTFRHINHGAEYVQLFKLAEAINRFQDEEVRRVLLVTVREF